ncbi:unnamed protein product [marine sediment metagenome]|uniref:Uncharacterized protein n=1 Tax=marine sediment metagenome TaxID=412755 RepID=X1PW48_9ZZZZ
MKEEQINKIKKTLKRHNAELAEIQVRLAKLEDILKVIQKEKE